MQSSCSLTLDLPAFTAMIDLPTLCGQWCLVLFLGFHPSVSSTAVSFDDLHRQGTVFYFWPPLLSTADGNRDIEGSCLPVWERRLVHTDIPEERRCFEKFRFEKHEPGPSRSPFNVVMVVQCLRDADSGWGCPRARAHSRSLASRPS